MIRHDKACPLHCTRECLESAYASEHASANALAAALADALVWLDTELADADTDERRERLVSDVERYRSALESYRKARGE